MEMNIDEFPEQIKKFIIGKEYTTNNIGMSGSFILLFDDLVLKIEKIGLFSKQECEMLKWLQGKLPVPKIISIVQKDEYNYLLMSKIKGEMTCSEELLKTPEKIIPLVAEALRMMWSVDISGCPVNNSVDSMLESAKNRILNNEVDFPEEGVTTLDKTRTFHNPNELYEYLELNKPTHEELVFSHGDFCMPNIMIENNDISGFVDLGRSGISNKWNDIALFTRSLEYNVGKRPDLIDLLFKELKIVPDHSLIEYFILLDEL